MFIFPPHVWFGSAFSDPSEIGGGPPGGGGSSPVDGGSATLVLWWDFTDQTVLFTDDGGLTNPTDGQMVRRVNNKGSGTNLDGYAGSGSGAPSVDGDRALWETGVRNGKAACDFDIDTANGIVNFEQDTTAPAGSKFTDNKNVTIFWIGQVPAGHATESRSPWGTSNDVGVSMWIRPDSAANVLRFRVNGGGAGATNFDGDPDLGTHWNAGEWYLCVVELSSDDVTGAIEVWYNDAKPPAPATIDPETEGSYAGLGGMRCGCASTSGSDADRFGWDSYIAHIGVYDEVLGTTKRTQLFDWANNELSLTDSLGP